MSAAKRYGSSAWCDRHWQPYREGAPGGVTATVKLAQAALSHPRMHEATKGQTERINEAFAQLGPACCLVGDAYLETLRQWAALPAGALCLADTGILNGPCHREKGHADGVHEHFWPPLPGQVTH